MAAVGRILLGLGHLKTGAEEGNEEHEHGATEK
jgi:hypothetical protein